MLSAQNIKWTNFDVKMCKFWCKKGTNFGVQIDLKMV